MIEYGREANRTEKNCIKSAELLDTIGRHHGTGFEIAFATPVEILPLEGYAKNGGNCLENLDALRYDFLAYAITRDDCNAICGRHLTPEEELANF